MNHQSNENNKIYISIANQKKWITESSISWKQHTKNDYFWQTPKKHKLWSKQNSDWKMHDRSIKFFFIKKWVYQLIFLQTPIKKPISEVSKAAIERARPRQVLLQFGSRGKVLDWAVGDHYYNKTYIHRVRYIIVMTPCHIQWQILPLIVFYLSTLSWLLSSSSALYSIRNPLKFPIHGHLCLN